MSLSGTMAMTAGSLNLFSLGIHVSSHNIANAHTPDYVRERLIIATSPPYRLGNVLLGTGAHAVGIRQELDQYLEGRIQGTNGEHQLALTLSDAYKQLESVLQSLGDNDLSSQTQTFVASLQAVVNQPENSAVRSVAIQQGQTFADNIRLLRGRIDQLRESQTAQITGLVDKVNELLSTVERLNPQISQMEANGLALNDAGGLRNQRAAALTKLSELIPIRVVERPDGGVDVFSGSDWLLLGGTSQRLETAIQTVDGETTVSVRTTATQSLLDGSGGRLSGLVEARDSILKGFTAQLDRFTAAVIGEINRIHASGEGIKGFTSLTGANAVADLNAPLSAAGLDFPPQNGSFQIKVKNLGTGLTETTNIAVDLDGLGTDTSLTSLASDLNGVGNVTAAITPDGRLQLTAAPGFEIRFAEDSSGVLAALGINTFFTGKDSTTIQVNEILKLDAGFLATGRGGGPSDNRNAVALATAFDRGIDRLDGLSISQFWDATKANTAQASAAQSAVADGLGNFRDALVAQREQQSGVNLDEELILILQFQHSYQAAARIISTIEQLMNTLLSI